MDAIVRREIIDPDRAAVQASVIDAVETKPELFLERYQQDYRSLGGRYICADLFKETFPEYRESKETRNAYNTAVHNAAAVLAAEQFKRVLADGQAGSSVVFLTGIPGAGKTSAVLSGGVLPDVVHAVFEGQLVKAATTIPKIQLVLDAGMQPVIVAVHTLPEVALRNTFQRFNEEGRGASIGVMSEIQGGLPNGLREVRQHFGDAVQLQVMDCRDWLDRKTLVGWENVVTLESEGSREQIRNRLDKCLREYHADGRISDACFRQASGAAPEPRNHGLVAGNHCQHQSDGSGRGLPEVNRPTSVVADTSASGAVPPEGVPIVRWGTRTGTIADVTPAYVIQNVGRGERVAYPRELFQEPPPLQVLAKITCNDGRATVVQMAGKNQALER